MSDIGDVAAASPGSAARATEKVSAAAKDLAAGVTQPDVGTLGSGTVEGAQVRVVGCLIGCRALPVSVTFA